MKLFLSLAISLLFLSSAYSDDLLVNSSGLVGSYTTISAAVQAASAGDRILISPQIMPYQEDTLVIDKDLTLMPYANNSFVFFEGNMQLTLDSIANFTLIGFRGNSNFENLFSVFNDTSRNSLSVINIIDCMINKIHMDQPKTSLYLSYSKTNQVAFSHGDIIGNHIGNLYFGNFDYNSPVVSSVISANHAFSNGILYEPNYSAFWPNSEWETYYGNSVNTTDNALNSTWFITECELFENYIPFGNVDVYSDTCNIIANYFHSSYNPTTLFNLDFPFNISNNFFANSGKNFIYLTCPTSKGTNQCVNNNRSKIELYLSYCVATSEFNFSDVTIEHLNNYDDSRISIYSPNNISGTHYSSLPVSKNSIQAYNAQAFLYSSGDGTSGPGFEDLMWNVGPHSSNSNENPNPSLKYLNLDLTPNIVGIDGGSHAWINYHGTEDVQAESTLQDVVDAVFQSAIDPTGYSDFGYDVATDIESVVSKQAGRMPTGSKARITYLNLPTQIFDPANIRVKAKAVHGN